MFLGLTRSYTDSGESRVADLLLPTHDSAWTLEPKAPPELDEASRGTVSPSLEAQVREEAMVGGLAEGTPEYEGAAEEGMEAVREQASAYMEEARAAARRAELIIGEWHEKGNFRVEMLKMVETAARLGTGVLMGPRRELSRRAAFKVKEGLKVLDVEDAWIPVSRSVSPWNCFFDPECGEDVQNGSFHWERDWIQRRDLQSLIGEEGYVGESIEIALRQGPMQVGRRWDTEAPGGGPSPTADSWGRFEIWYGYMDVAVDEMEAAMGSVPEGVPAGSVVSVSVQMVNDRIIRMEPTLMAAGGDRFPYSYFRWAKMYDSDGAATPWGRGIPALLRVPQRALTSAYNAAMHNAVLTSVPMFEYDAGLIKPVSGAAEIAAGKLWSRQTNVGETGHGNTTGIRPIVIPSMIGDMTAWMQVNMQLCEDLSGLTGVTGSAAGRNAPDTVGGMQLASNQADSAIRRVVRMMDDDLIEPHVQRYYEYLLLDPDVPESAKRDDFTVRAKGVSVLERSMKIDLLVSMLNLAVNPAFGIDPARVMRELTRLTGFDPERLELTPEQMRAMDEAARAEAERPDPALEVAQIKAQADLEKAGVQANVEMAKAQNELQVEAMREKRNVQDLQVEEFKAILQAMSAEEKTQIQAMLDRERMDREDARKLDENKVRIAEFTAKLRQAGAAARRSGNAE